mgnify:CR=1 FL=1
MTTEDQAREFAEKQHAGQLYGTEPYAVHLAAVRAVLASIDAPPHLCVAAWLHDTVEDTDTTPRELEERFGADVAAVVWAVSGFGPNRKGRNLDAAMVEHGLVVKASGPQGDFTVGPYTKAVGPPTCALFGYGRAVPEPYQAREGTAVAVGRLLVSCVGAGRAREAALTTKGRPALSDAAGQIARARREHVSLCRAVHCKVCR